ncbi:MAG TPA: hypothetical protein VFN85_10935 [Solirubrobacterales bacterium]|nr:hypothetical protein [Solirubrobacterales bacterium]
MCGPARVLVPAAAFGGAAAIALVPFARAWPLLFGFLAGTIGDGSGEALRTAFLVMLVPLGAAGAILLYARRTYPADAAAAGGDGSRR